MTQMTVEKKFLEVKKTKKKLMLRGVMLVIGTPSIDPKKYVCSYLAELSQTKT